MKICCTHPLSEHGEDGCLHGWDAEAFLKGQTGCWCMNPGTADR